VTGAKYSKVGSCRSKHRRAKLAAFAGSIIYEPDPMAPNESGALPISGTEVPIPLMAPGFSLHDELQTTADAGMSAYYETIFAIAFLWDLA